MGGCETIFTDIIKLLYNCKQITSFSVIDEKNDVIEDYEIPDIIEDKNIYDK